MDILYVVGKKSNYYHVELRYSLRSIAKYGKNIGKVYVVGYNPGFLSDEVIHIPHEDNRNYVGKHKNMLDSIIYAVKNSDIKENFLLSSDDHFYIKDTDFNTYPYYCKGILPERIPDNVPNKLYFKSLVDTSKLLLENGYTTYDFSQHGNTHCSRTVIELYEDLLKKSFNTKIGCEPTCLILNILYKTCKFSITRRIDFKVDKNQDRNYVIKNIGNREVFSIANTCNPDILMYLQELYVDKCKYEK